MNPLFVITDHALDRFVERYDGIYDLTPDQYERFLLAELERGVRFGGQVGDGVLYLLPCGLVAAVVRDHGKMICEDDPHARARDREYGDAGGGAALGVLN